MTTTPLSANDLKSLINGDHRADMISAEAHICGGRVIILYKELRHFPKNWIDHHVAQAGWYLTRTEPNPDYNIEVVEPTTVPPVPINGRLYHATRASNLPLIVKNGITTSAQGRTWMKRTYHSPRSFHARSLEAAAIFIKSMESSGSAKDSSVVLTPQLLAGWEIVSFDPAHDVFYPDAEYDVAVWTEAIIASDRLTIEQNWRHLNP